MKNPFGKGPTQISLSDALRGLYAIVMMLIMRWYARMRYGVKKKSDE